MAMEKHCVVRDLHVRPITAIGFHNARRELMIGFEDGVVKVLEDTGAILNSFQEHTGWITNFLYWPEQKILFSSANDGVIVAWGSGGSVTDKISMGQPVYTMAINPRRHQLVCGINGGIKVYDLDDERLCGHLVNNEVVYFAREHTDIVRSLFCYESRVYSVGYDQKLIIYDSSYTGDKSMKPIVINTTAHAAGITNLLQVKDSENNNWIITGSFDKTVRIWSTDGKLVHMLDNFLGSVSGICYVPANKTIWIAAGADSAYMYDPKSGDNVSDFIGTFQNQDEDDRHYLHVLQYVKELNCVIGSTMRRQIVMWKYNSSGCITALKNPSALECLTYTKKVPLLLFSGDLDGTLTKWERMESNYFMYSKEYLSLNDARKTKRNKRRSITKAKEEHTCMDENKEDSHNKLKLERAKSHYKFNKPVIPPISMHRHKMRTILKIIFVEEMDVVVAACEDCSIYVWGFDMEAVQVLKGMKPPEQDHLIRKYAILLDQDSMLLPQNKIPTTRTEDSVTNRVAGFICKHILYEHTSCVTSLAIVEKSLGFEHTYAISAGWDRRICVWNLDTGMLEDVFRNKSHTEFSHMEIACDGIITDLCYHPKRNEFAYSSADKMVYLRKFSTIGTDMVLLNTLQGHYMEVTSVKWNHVIDKWVTGSEDGTIRIWSTVGLNECEQVLTVQGAVSALCFDVTNGCIIAGVQSVIKVFETTEYKLIQTNEGHTDAIKSIIHIPERHQYISCSVDKTIRVWNAWRVPKKKVKKVSIKEKGRKSVQIEEPDEKGQSDEKETESVPVSRTNTQQSVRFTTDSGSTPSSPPRSASSKSLKSSSVVATPTQSGSSKSIKTSQTHVSASPTASKSDAK